MELSTMNPEARLWWTQAQSDFEIFEHLLRTGFPQCHCLHYLQMSSEKIAKAYFWEKAATPQKLTHSAFVRFRKMLGSNSKQSVRDSIALILGFETDQKLQQFFRSSFHIARQIEMLAPSLAGDGANAEYPWPNASPTNCPAGYRFFLYDELKDTWYGRQTIMFLRHAITRFDQYAHL
jgi:hypothetical protein